VVVVLVLVLVLDGGVPLPPHIKKAAISARTIRPPMIHPVLLEPELTLVLY
jgi:hypothetical protein